ncbi:hypothetical protein Vadar_013698 [Vaccinium darrowii]|uniref:Uncharacterized protein n=1 Tax=Vaccinium darrowii TaxID=229202 RepID=A0ACB7Z4G6_9ERIC|nr:hypothetical protein Vadar_013698 [Vaccinium darrowii]
MRAIPVRHARIRPIIEVRPFSRPFLHRLSGRPPVSLSPKYVLAVVAVGVDQSAVAPPLSISLMKAAEVDLVDRRWTAVDSDGWMREEKRRLAKRRDRRRLVVLAIVGVWCG